MGQAALSQHVHPLPRSLARSCPAVRCLAVLYSRCGRVVSCHRLPPYPSRVTRNPASTGYFLFVFRCGFANLLVGCTAQTFTWTGYWRKLRSGVIIPVYYGSRQMEAVWSPTARVRRARRVVFAPCCYQLPVTLPLPARDRVLRGSGGISPTCRSTCKIFSL